jgi:peptide/nickel transport system substrate-binding protein
VKNPNYWGYDPRHPENKLPYADTLKLLIIPDAATAMAALRTGKIGMLDNISQNQLDSLKKTNPELVYVSYPATGTSVEFRCDLAPFTDIRVRKAMQMAIDRDTIAKTYYGGAVSGTPVGYTHPLIKEYNTPFEEWPKETQEEYTYNPERAKELLSEAGYPTGFKTNCVIPTTQDADLMQIVKAYFADIGVDMEIRVMDAGALEAFLKAFKHDQMSARVPNATGLLYHASRLFTRRLSNYSVNYTKNNDPYYDDLYNQYTTSMDINEQISIWKKAEMYALSQHWSVQTLPTVVYIVRQPWFKGHVGETSYNYALYWID